jgi:hypothetical protein
VLDAVLIHPSPGRKIIASVPAYAGFRPRAITVDEFQSRWLDGLERDGLLVGINWSGARATGYHVEPVSCAIG